MNLRSILQFLLLFPLSLAAQQDSCLDFTQSSSDYVRLPTDLTFTDLTGLTVSIWYKSTTFCDDFGCQSIFDLTDGTCDNCWDHRYSLGQKGHDFTFGSEGNAGLSWNVSATLESTEYLNEWIHIVCVTDHDVDSVHLYINGVREASEAYTSAADLISLGTGISTSRILGNRAVSLNRALTAFLDDLSIWNYALSKSEVASLYQSCLEGIETGLIACYDFNDGMGTTLSDKAENGYDGVLVNSPLWSSDVKTIDCQPFNLDNQNAVATQIDSTNLYLNNPGINGIIMQDVNGDCWKVTIDTTGQLNSRRVACPSSN